MDDCLDEYLDFTSSQGIRDYLNECARVENNLEKELNEMYIGLFSPKRHELKKRKAVIKSRLKRIRNNIRLCLNLLEKYTTFNDDIFLPFLRDYLSLKEDEKYELLLDVEELNFGMALITKTYPLNLYGDHYNIVTTEENRDILMECQDSCSFADIDDINDYLENLDNDKYICLEDSNCYTLLDGLDLSSDFENYPYLFDVANELVDMKLANPDMCDEERLESILDALRKKKGVRENSNILKQEFWR